MSPQQTRDFKVGLTTLIAVVMFAAGLMWAKGCGLQANSNIISARFPSTSGLLVGDAVCVNGVKKGIVKDITLDSTGVLVTMSLDKDIELHTDATATVMMLELLGGKKIEIFPGTSTEELHKDQVIVGKFAPDIPSVMNTIGNVSDDVVGVIRRIDTLLIAMTGVSERDPNRSRINNIFYQLDEASSNLAEVIRTHRGDMETSLTNLRDITAEVRGYLRRNTASLDTITKNADKTFSAAARAAVKADSLVASLNDMIVSLKTKRSVAGRILYDEAFGERLDKTVTTLLDFLNEVRDDGIKANIRFFH